MLHRGYTSCIDHLIPFTIGMNPWVTGLYSINVGSLSGHVNLPRQPVMLDCVAHKSTERLDGNDVGRHPRRPFCGGQSLPHQY